MEFSLNGSSSERNSSSSRRVRGLNASTLSTTASSSDPTSRVSREAAWHTRHTPLSHSALSANNRRFVTASVPVPASSNPNNKQVDDSTFTTASISTIQAEEEEEELAITKLRFGDELYGHRAEHQALSECLERLVAVASSSTAHNTNAAPQEKNNKKKQELVLIRGVSGSGKTALAESMRRAVPIQKRRHRFVVVRGKFDFMFRDDVPYAGWVAACHTLCEEILRTPQLTSSSSNGGGSGNNEAEPSSLLENIRTKLTENLGEERHVLVRILPILHEILGTNPTNDKNNNHGPSIGILGASFAEAKNRFHYAFQRFFRTMTTFFSPLIILLDDLHNADTASLELLEVLITDQDLPGGLMVIGCYRSNLEHHPPLTRAMEHLRLKPQQQQETQSCDYNLTEISLGDLALPDVNQLLVDLLSVDDETKTLELAKVCHNKTHGNPFHLVTYLSMLAEQSLLVYNLGLLKWKWNVAEIDRETVATSNVVDLMKRTLSELTAHNNNISRVLLVAACLGSTFRETILSRVWKHYSEKNCDCSSDNSNRGDGEDPNSIVSKSLHMAVEKTLVFHETATAGSSGLSDHRYRWAHDSIQEAALAFAGDDVDALDLVRVRVGEILVAELTDMELEAEIFVVVNLVDPDSNHNGKAQSSYANTKAKQIRLAELNLRAAQQATKISAMESASKYANRGINHLPADRWESHYEVTLELFSVAAEAECASGNVESMRIHCNEVLTHAQGPLLDKMRVYHSLLDNASNNNTSQARDQCLDVLQKLGCRFPKTEISRTIHAVATLFKIKGKIKALSDEDIDGLPIMTDERRIKIMKLLEKLTTYCYLTGSNMLFVLVTFRSIQWTLKYGLSDSGPTSFASGGVLVSGALNDFEAGAVYARYSLAMLKKLRRKRLESRTLFLLHTLVLPWSNPVQSSLKPLLRCWQVGLESGDIEHGFYGIGSYLQLALQSGRPLKSLEHDCCTYTSQMKDFQRIMTYKAICQIWQTVHNLMGLSPNTTVLSGSIVDREQVLGEEDDPFVLAFYHSYQQHLYAWFGEHELGAELAIKRGDSIDKAMPGGALSAMDPLFKGISLFAMARKTKSRLKKIKYARYAKKMMLTVKSWVEKGKNPNLIHQKQLLEAEHAALRGKKQDAVDHYKLATISSARGGFIHEAALANERYSEFLLEEMKDREEGVYRMEQAIKLYTEWGAHAKVVRLREKYSESLEGMTSEIILNF